jgi:glycosyltransferase involved in cell wall biosynthesis
MNIAHITNYISNIYGGVSVSTRRMASALSHLGVGISIFSLNGQNKENSFREDGMSTHLYGTGWPTGWWRSTGLANALRETAKDYDIFHIHEVWTYPQYIAGKIARKRGIPYILAPRASLEPWRMQYKGFKKKLYLHLIGNRLLDNSVCLHAVATAEAEGFRKVGYRGPICIIHNGIVPEEFTSLPDPAAAETKWPFLKGRRVVLFFSRLSPEKGLDEMIPAWSAIVKKPTYSDALLVLAGPDDRGYRLTIEEMIRRADAEKQIFLTGMVDGKDKFALISRANIYALPSYSEGFSNSLLENLAAGKPVLITPGCNFPQVVEAGAGLCVDPERGCLEEGLKNLLDMPRGTLAEMGSRGRRLVMEEFTWEIAARKILAVYHAILNGREIPLHPKPVPVDSDGKAVWGPNDSQKGSRTTIPPRRRECGNP